MRRIIVGLIMTISAGTVSAQTYLPGSYNGRVQQTARPKISINDSIPAKKWFVTKYAALSTSYMFSKYGNASIMAAPVGIQLNRRLNNNWYAFAGLSAAPAYINFNQSFLNANTKFSQANGFMRGNSFNLFPRAEMGLMYMNDQKTFSISGSISVEKSSYPFGAFNQFGGMGSMPYLAPVR